ncbi:GNAT family N-acetyltransferase [Bacteroides sp. KG156]|uniref:GNAT family N-acetyltransferase n=1 Tax=unclassified Bacteroides TaxID=2646097 RepID=UPI003D9820FE
MNEIVIRQYKPGDEQGINMLFIKHLPYLRDNDFWLWINRIVGGTSIIFIAECDKKIIGHYAIVPRSVIVGDVSYKSGLGIHAFVDPDYRDRVSVFQISDMAYKEACKQGYAFIYGFPNSNYRFIQEKIEKWNCVSLFNALELNLKGYNPIFINNLSHEKVNFNNYNDLFILQSLFEKSKKMLVMPENGVQYWYMRYFMHPQKLYKPIKIYSDNDCVEGYFILKKYIKEEKTYYHIVDYIVGDTTMIKSMLLYLLNIAKKAHVDVFSMWRGDDTLELSAKEIGFEEIGFETFFGIKKIDKNLDTSLMNKLLQFSNWRLVMGDSDSF